MPSSSRNFEFLGWRDCVKVRYKPKTGNRLQVTGDKAEALGPWHLPEFLARLVRTDERGLFLATVPETSYPAADALLILLLGYKLAIKKDIVSGKDLLDSLKKTGVEVQRIDRIFGRYLGGTQALVVKMGIRRGVKYKLTERGVSRARELARSLS